MNIIQKLFGKPSDNQTESKVTPQSVGKIFGTTISKGDFDAAFSSISYSCIRLRSQAVSSLKYNLYYDYGNGDKEIVEDTNWFKKLMNRPNPNMNFRLLLKMTQMWLDYNGNAYIYAEYDENDIYPSALYLLQSSNVSLIMGQYGPSYYKYKYGRNTLEIPASDIIHIKTLLPGTNPEDDFIGKSLVSRIRETLLSEQETNEYIKRHYSNDTIPPIILKSEHEIDESAIQNFQISWNNKLPNHKMLGALTGGLDVEFLDGGEKLSLENTNKLLLEKISILYGIPYEKLTGGATSLASAAISDFSFRMDTIEPLAYEIIDAFNMFLERYDPYLRMDFEEFNYVDPNTKMLQEKSDLLSGVLTINEVRAQRGLEPVAWGYKPRRMDVSDVSNDVGQDGGSIVS